MMQKAWCSIEEVLYYFSWPSIKFQGHTGWKIDNLNRIRVRLLGWSQLSNPSDLPCLAWISENCCFQFIRWQVNVKWWWNIWCLISYDQFFCKIILWFQDFSLLSWNLIKSYFPFHSAVRNEKFCYSLLSILLLSGITKTSINIGAWMSNDIQGPLLLSWISNHMPNKVWDEITYPFLNFNGCTVEV